MTRYLESYEDSNKEEGDVLYILSGVNSVVVCNEAAKAEE